MSKRSARTLHEPVWDETNITTAFKPGNRRGSSVSGQLRQALGSLASKAEQAAAVGNRNFQLRIPVVRLPGRGLDLSLDLTYNSSLWHKAGNKIYFDLDADWPAPGWSLGFGKLVELQGTGHEAMLIEADGTRHPFIKGDTIEHSDGSEFTYFTTDGSLIDYHLYQDRRTGLLAWGRAEYPDGTFVHFAAISGNVVPAQGNRVLYPTYITDANGNYITITYRSNTGPRIDTITDTLGRKIVFHYDVVNRRGVFLTAITGPGLKGETRTFVRLSYRYRGFDWDFGHYAFVDGLEPVERFAPAAIKAIYFPMGTGYWFGDEDSYSTYGMVAKVTEQYGMGFKDGPSFERGTITPGNWMRERKYNYPDADDPPLEDAPRYTEMTETWTDIMSSSARAVTRYLVDQSDSPRRVEMTYPDGSKHVQLSHNTSGGPAEEQWKDGLVDRYEIRDANGKVLRATSILWIQDWYKSPRVHRTEITDELGQKAYTHHIYDASRKHVIETTESDYGGSLLRRVLTRYANYEHRHIFNLPEVVEVYDDYGTVPMSRTRYVYDGSPLADAPGVVGHSNPLTASRGNVTQITNYANAAHETGAITETRRYDITGNLIATSTAPDRQTSYAYTKDTQYAYPTAQTVGAASPSSQARVTTSASYDCGTGLLRSTTDANGRTTVRTYYPASLRPHEVVFPTGATTTYDYAEEALNVTETTSDSSGRIAAKRWVGLNGLGLVNSGGVLAEEAPDAWDLTATEYDAMGRLWRQWVPERGGARESGQWSEISYDGLGRVILTRAPDGSEERRYYNEQTRPSGAPLGPGQTERVVDAWGRERWTLTDALGRVLTVVEPNPGGSGSVFEAGHVSTQYDYNALDKLVAIRQPGQLRRFRYDSLGRPTHQHLPEKSATLDDEGEYVGAGADTTLWSDVFTYDDCSNLATYTDARGVKTVYDYMGDPLCRLRTVIYDTAGVPDADKEGILLAGWVGREYETTGDVRRLSRVEATYASEEYRYDAEGRLRSRTQRIVGPVSEPQPLTVAYAYDDLNRPKQLTYPTKTEAPDEPGALVEYEYDPASRLRGLKVDGTYHASQITHSAAGQVEALRVGPGGPNQVIEDYGYDAATGLLDRQSVQRETGEPLLDLSYAYQQLGDSNGGRTGQLTRITDNLDPHKSRGYAYDALGRLVRARGGSDPAAPLWLQLYSYDPYGNRTRVTATGQADDGTPIPSDGLAQVDYDAETNRITTPGFEYDAAGNPTRVRLADGTWQRYQYDAAGRLAKVCDDDGTLLEGYVYGAGRQRVAMQLGETPDTPPTYYVWDRGNVLAEYIGEWSSGGYEWVNRWKKDYVHLGGRLLSTSTQRADGEVIEYHHPDRLGTRLVTGGADDAVLEQVTLPFGTVLEAESTGETNRRFTSYDRSATTGLDYAVNRFYDPQLGRFTQVDPLEAGAISIGDPRSHNLYSYVRNDPVNLIDPLGLDLIFGGSEDICARWDPDSNITVPCDQPLPLPSPSPRIEEREESDRYDRVGQGGSAHGGDGADGVHRGRGSRPSETQLGLPSPGFFEYTAVAIEIAVKADPKLGQRLGSANRYYIVTIGVARLLDFAWSNNLLVWTGIWDDESFVTDLGHARDQVWEHLITLPPQLPRKDWSPTVGGRM